VLVPDREYRQTGTMCPPANMQCYAFHVSPNGPDQQSVTEPY
jgi:hypothetical protein